MPEDGRSRPSTGAAGDSAGAATATSSGTATAGGTATATGTATPTANATGDWASETADRIDHLIATVRSQTTDRVVSIARLVVFGLLAAVMGGMAGVLLVVAAVRALDELIPQEVWLTYLVLG